MTSLRESSGPQVKEILQNQGFSDQLDQRESINQYSGNDNQFEKPIKSIVPDYRQSQPLASSRDSTPQLSSSRIIFQNSQPNPRVSSQISREDQYGTISQQQSSSKQISIFNNAMSPVGKIPQNFTQSIYYDNQNSGSYLEFRQKSGCELVGTLSEFNKSLGNRNGYFFYDKNQPVHPFENQNSNESENRYFNEGNFRISNNEDWAQSVSSEQRVVAVDSKRLKEKNSELKPIQENIRFIDLNQLVTQEDEDKFQLNQERVLNKEEQQIVQTYQEQMSMEIQVNMTRMQMQEKNQMRVDMAVAEKELTVQYGKLDQKEIFTGLILGQTQLQFNSAVPVIQEVYCNNCDEFINYYQLVTHSQFCNGILKTVISIESMNQKLEKILYLLRKKHDLVISLNTYEKPWLKIFLLYYERILKACIDSDYIQDDLEHYLEDGKKVSKAVNQCKNSNSEIFEILIIQGLQAIQTQISLVKPKSLQSNQNPAQPTPIHQHNLQIF